MTDHQELLRAEIERLKGAINRHKSKPPVSHQNTFHGIDYEVGSSRNTHMSSFKPLTVKQHREVVIDGVAFRSSRRCLVRKDASSSSTPRHEVSQSRGKPYQRPYKLKASNRQARGYNMTLTNGRKPNSRKIKSMKYIDKQCSRFSVSGVCPKGKTCPYKHDPSKIAICWPFLQGTCPNTAETCYLSHHPTPERTPLCVHFTKNGFCKNGESCLFPHIRVEQRVGVCRDFAVLGYCEKGVDCDKQHVRECPDFAEKNACPNSRCKLPHVIRSNQRRTDQVPSTDASEEPIKGGDRPAASDTDEYRTHTNDLQGVIGDEYISLTFHESDASEMGSESEDTEETDEEESESEEENEEVKVHM